MRVSNGFISTHTPAVILPLLLCIEREVMSNNYTEEDFDQDLDNEVEESASDLRKAARRGSKALRELEQMKKELAFYKAGISMDDPKMKYFVRGYDGEMTPEAIRIAALESGFIASQEPKDEQQNEVQQQVFSAQQRISAASAGAGFQDTSEAAAIALMEQAMEEGGVEAMLDVAQQFGMEIGEA